MAKVTFTFDTYEDAEDLKLFQQALETHNALWVIKQKVRHMWKYGEYTEDEHKIIDKIYEYINTTIVDSGIDI